MAITICLTMVTSTVPVMANPITSIAATVPESIRIGYEQSIIERMAGRAGAAVENGAKGIVHEIMYTDKLNCSDLLNKGVKTSLTKSSTAPQVDVVTTNDGKVTARYQLKDTANSIDNTIKQVKSGKYNQAQLIGTTETAEAFNAKAASQGISKVMKSSGISSKTTSRIAEKALNNVPSATRLAKTAAKGAGIGAVIDGAVAAGESIYRGDDFSEATGHIAVGTTTGAVSMGVASVAGEVAAAGLTAAGVTGAATVVLPAAAVVGVGIGAGLAIDKASEQFEVEEKISQAIDNTTEKYEIDEKISNATDTVKNGINQGVNTVTDKIDNIRK